jgi:hypothetical protein
MLIMYYFLLACVPQPCDVTLVLWHASLQLLACLKQAAAARFANHWE